MAGYRLIVAVLAATLLAGAPLVAQQTDSAVAPGRPSGIPDGSPGDALRGQTPSATPDQRQPPAPDAIPLPGMLAPDGKPAPNTLVIRAQYDAGMQTVDSGVAQLVPFVARTVIGLKRLALGRIAADRAIADVQWRQVAGGLRDLAVADQRLRYIDGILDRWRMAAPTSPQEQARMLAGVHQRSGEIGILRRQVACGRYFGDVTGRAIRSGAVGRINARIPPGC